MELFSFRNFSVYYKVKKDFVVAVDNVTFDIGNGEIFVMVGESGSGKTSLLRSMFRGAEGATRGELLFNGTPVEEVDVTKQNFAYVSQYYSLNAGMTVYDNIAFPLRNMKADHAETDRRVRSIAKAFGIYPLLTRKPRQLSGGQHQRAAIARAFIKNPRVIFMDEPFSALDPKSKTLMRELLLRVHEHLNCTVVFVTHDLPEAFAIADRILVLERGRVVESGTPAALERSHVSSLLKEFFKV